MKVRTRFAPSPTGFQHLGGFRTAMYAWLLARHYNGSFILRIEDTDQERKVAGAIKYILESLDQLGITIDEGPSKADLEAVGELWDGAPDLSGEYGPYIQSARLERYQEVAQILIEKGVAYRCDMTADQLEAEREQQVARGEAPGYSGYSRDRNVSVDTEHVVRLRIPDQFLISVDDAVRGTIRWENPPLRDPVLLKSDGYPTYHLAVVVDDHDMQISHVMRGEEWISSTPIHLYLYDQLGWERPTFCHLSVILGDDGKKLSKRHGAVALEGFVEQGYLIEALLNYIVLIGWSAGEGSDQELFTKDELIKEFSLKGLSSASGVFDPQKLNWMNGVYIRELSSEIFYEKLQPVLEKHNIQVSSQQWELLGAQVQERCKLLTDVVPMLEFLKTDTLKRDLAFLEKKKVSEEDIGKIREAVKAVFLALEEFTVETVDKALREVPEQVDLKLGKVFQTVRILITGSMATPPLPEALVALGKETCLARLE